jgi:hypothetical protein
MSYGDGECDTLSAGTIYSQTPEDLLSGLPTQLNYERDLSRRWLKVDRTDYAAKGYYAGRQAGLQTAECPRRRFVATALIPVAADEGDEIKEDRLVTANLYSGELNDS